MNETTKTLIWVGVVAVAFIVLWQQGVITRIANYVRETREELKKCNWPTLEELKGSTALVFVAVALLAAFTIATSYVFSTIYSHLIA